MADSCRYLRAAPYADDILNLPVRDLAAAVCYYEDLFGFHVVSRSESPCLTAVLERDEIQIGLAENGGDPTQEGAFFEVDNVEAAFEELRRNGFDREDPAYRMDQHKDGTYKVFFVVAPDELCYCIGEKQH